MSDERRTVGADAVPLAPLRVRVAAAVGVLAVLGGAVAAVLWSLRTPGSGPESPDLWTLLSRRPRSELVTFENAGRTVMVRGTVLAARPTPTEPGGHPDPSDWELLVRVDHAARDLAGGRQFVIRVGVIRPLTAPAGELERAATRRPQALFFLVHERANRYRASLIAAETGSGFRLVYRGRAPTAGRGLPTVSTVPR